MVKRLATAVLLAAMGCGDGEDPGPTLEGFWYIENSDGCLLGLVVEGEQYQVATICDLEGGGVGIEAEAGTVWTEGDEITFVPKQSSCPNGDHSTDVLNYDFVGDQLRLSGNAGILIFERGEDASGSGPGGQASYGCYDEEGYFTASPVADI